MITVTGETLNDVKIKIGAIRKYNDIEITFRELDYGSKPLAGCVVSVRGERVARDFDSAAAATRYISSVLKKRDALAKETAKQKKKAKK